MEMVELFSQQREMLSTILFFCKIFEISLTVFLYKGMIRYVCKEKH
jgi:hypothetical protein